MKKDKKRRMCCVLLCLLLTTGLVGCKGEEAPESYEYTESENVAVAETQNLHITIENDVLDNENDRNWAVYRMEQAYNNAMDFLGENYTSNDKLECSICAGEGLTQISKGSLSIYFYDTVEQPYTNYMIQALAGTNAPDYLREGLAAYGADLAGESLLESYGVVLTELDAIRTADDDSKSEYADISALARILYEDGSFEEALALSDMLKNMSQMETAEDAASYRAAYCIYSGSFVGYLVEQKGLDKVLRIYNGEEFYAVMGQSLQNAQKAWINDTFNQ